MIRKSLITILAVSSVLVLASCRFAGQKEVSDKNIETVRLGFIGPLTGDGANYGTNEKDAIIMAVEEINGSNYLPGKRLDVIFEDGECDGKTTTTVANKLINVDNVKVIFGGLCSTETLAAAPITEEKEVILLSAFSTSPEITKAGDFVFRTVPSDDGITKFVAELAKKSGHERIALLSENNDYGLGLHNGFKKWVPEVGLEIVKEITYLPGAKDFRTDILQLKSKNPDAIFANPQTGVGAGLILKQIRELSWDVQVYGVYVFTGSDALTTGGKAMEGLIAVNPPIVEKDVNPKGSEFMNKYISRFGAPQDNFLIASAYDNVYLIADAIKNVGLNSKGIRYYLYNLDSFTGAAGTYHFDKNGDVVGISFSMQTIKDGKVVPYEG